MNKTSRILFVSAASLLSSAYSFAGKDGRLNHSYEVTINDTAKDDGIHFVEGASWKQIQEMARKENKFIFLDCYATWCGPCKMMEHEVYPQKSVGDFFNAKYLSVKVQMDSTGNDNAQIRSWYNDSREIFAKYDIKALPTFLFMSPEGNLVHKAMGGMSPEAFVDLGKAALDPEKQFYTQIEKFKSGKISQAALRDLAVSSASFGEKEVADKMATAYLPTIKKAKQLTDEDVAFLKQFKGNKEISEFTQQYIDNLPKKDLYTKSNIALISSFTQSTKDKTFKFFVENGKAINKVMGDSIYSDRVLDPIISNEEINSYVFNPKNPADFSPDWKKLTETVASKYGASSADRNVTGAKIGWYSYKKNNQELINSSIHIIEKHRKYIGDFFVQNIAYNAIFKNSTNPKELETASRWMKEMMKGANSERGDLMSIYANLQYKAGKKDEAIAWQEKALKADAGNKNVASDLEKMKKGEPTW